MARILVQATFPHSRPKTHEFERVNGRFTLYMNAPPSVGLPYGSYPRLALAWLSTEAVRTRSREIELGPTFSSFMYKLGLTPVTGKRGTTSRLRNQLHRLFSTTIRCSYSDEAEGHAAGIGYTIAHRHELWWSPRDPEQRPLWNSVVVLSTEFYDELVAHAVPDRHPRPHGAQGIAPRARHLLLADLPDELPPKAVSHPVGGSSDSVRC